MFLFREEQKSQISAFIIIIKIISRGFFTNDCGDYIM